MDIKKEIAEMNEYFDNLSTEDYIKKFLCLNGTMNQNLFDKVMDELSDKCSLNSEDISYNKNKFNITVQEFMDVFYYLDKIAGDERIVTEDSFPATDIYFIYKGKKFIWNLIMGQGSFCSLLVYGYDDYNWDDNHSIVIKQIDPNIRFYKKLEEL